VDFNGLLALLQELWLQVGIDGLNIYRTWFYFGVKGTEKDEVLRFTIKNMNHQSKLYAAGLRPVLRLGT